MKSFPTLLLLLEAGPEASVREKKGGGRGAKTELRKRDRVKGGGVRQNKRGGGLLSLSAAAHCPYHYSPFSLSLSGRRLKCQTVAGFPPLPPLSLLPSSAPENERGSVSQKRGGEGRGKGAEALLMGALQRGGGKRKRPK